MVYFCDYCGKKIRGDWFLIEGSGKNLIFFPSNDDQINLELCNHCLEDIELGFSEKLKKKVKIRPISTIKKYGIYLSVILLMIFLMVSTLLGIVFFMWLL